MTQTDDFVLLDQPRPGITQVTLNRPERMNAMAFDVMVPLRDTLRDIAVDNETRVVVLTGAGTGFCSGADLVGSGVVPNVDGLTPTSIARRALQVLDDVILTLRSLPQPVIAAINGPAIGGGFCLALAADIRIAGASAYFRAAGINNGLTASELGLSFLLPRAVGSSRAFDIMLSGRDVNADEAERIGVVSRVVADHELLDSCYDLADQIMAFSRPGVELTKRTLWTSLDAASLAGHMEYEGISQLFVRMTTRNFDEAVLARKERRPPIFLD
jgi:enoyl-CoA hydratase